MRSQETHNGFGILRGILGFRMNNHRNFRWVKVVCPRCGKKNTHLWDFTLSKDRLEFMESRDFHCQCHHAEGGYYIGLVQDPKAHPYRMEVPKCRA